MENIQRDLEKKLSKANVKKKEGRRKNWTLLMVSDDGDVRRSLRVVSRVKIYRNLLLLCVAVVACLSWFSKVTFQENQSMGGRIRSLALDNRELKERNDLLTAELVMEEEKTDTDSAIYKPGGIGSTGREGVAPNNGDLQRKNVDRKAGSDIAKNYLEKVSPIRVSVGKFSVAEIIKKKLLKIQFVIRNKNPGSKAISGRIFVCLKGGNGVRSSEPNTDFKDGFPADPQKGQLFSISRYKTVFFNFKNIERPEIFDNAEIFVFSVKGKLIFNKTVPLSFKGAGNE